MRETSTKRARTVAAQAKSKLNRLMPYKEWCAALNPTPAAKELYRFVRLTLERQIAEAAELMSRSAAPSKPSKRARKPYARRQVFRRRLRTRAAAH